MAEKDITGTQGLLEKKWLINLLSTESGSGSGAVEQCTNCTWLSRCERCITFLDNFFFYIRILLWGGDFYMAEIGLSGTLGLWIKKELTKPIFF